MDKLKDLLFFEKMITPKILVFLYWITLIAILVIGVLTLFQNFAMGLGIMVGGTIIYRMSFEIIVIAFKNNEYLKKIAERE